MRLDFRRIVRIAMGVGRRDRLPAGRLRARSAICGAVGRASVNFGAANQKSPRPCQPFPSKRAGTSRAQFPKREAPNLLHQGRKPPLVRRARKSGCGPWDRSLHGPRAKRPPKADEPQMERIIRQKKRPRSGESHATQTAAAKPPMQAEAPEEERVTKQERMLTLLSQPAGASIEEMMQATGWQQHSVRGRCPG